MALRDSPFSEIKVPLTWAAGIAVVVAVAIAVFLLMSDRRETLEENAYGKVQATADRIQAPVSSVVGAPVRWIGSGIDGVRSFFGAVVENPRLRRENARIPELKAQLAAERDKNERLQAILGLKIDPPMPMVAALAVTDARGPFANSRLINVGREAGIKVGHPVMSENGLVGRVVGVSGGVSRVLLLTDVASGVPVMIDRTNARAILAGDGGAHPRLANMRSREQPKVGDTLVTSGDGGVFPRGLTVGVVVKGVDGSWRARLSSERAPIDYVRILKFESFEQLAEEQALSAPVAPVEMGGVIPPPAPPAPTLKVTGSTPGAAPAAKTPAPKAPAAKAAAPAPKTPAPASAGAEPKTPQPKTPQPKAPPPKAAAKTPEPTAPNVTVPPKGAPPPPAQAAQ